MGSVVLSGYYGFNNVGDETVLYAIIKTLRKIDPLLEITVLSPDPEKTAKQYGVKAVNRWKVFDILNTLSHGDLLISGGGSLLQDVTSKNSPLYYLGVILLAKLLGKKVMVYAQGIGPLEIKRNRRLAALLLERVHKITVRDEGSREELDALGLKRAMTVTSDPVLGLSAAEVDKSVGREILKRNGLDMEDKGPYLGVYIRPWQDNKYLTGLAQALDNLAQEGWKIIFIPMHFPGDIGVAKEAAKSMNHGALVLKEMFSPEEMLSITQNLDLVLGMRLHALIIGAVVGVPVVGLSYDPKVDRFLNQIGQHALISTGELSVEILVEMVKLVYGRREEMVAEIQGRLEPLYQKAWQNARIAHELLEKE